jgi:hypothetical protein
MATALRRGKKRRRERAEGAERRVGGESAEDRLADRLAGEIRDGWRRKKGKGLSDLKPEVGCFLGVVYRTLCAGARFNPREDLLVIPPAFPLPSDEPPSDRGEEHEEAEQSIEHLHVR